MPAQSGYISLSESYCSSTESLTHTTACPALLPPSPAPSLTSSHRLSSTHLLTPPCFSFPFLLSPCCSAFLKQQEQRRSATCRHGPESMRQTLDSHSIRKLSEVLLVLEKSPLMSHWPLGVHLTSRVSASDFYYI